MALICTWPDFDDQGLAIERELLARGMQVAWLCHDKQIQSVHTSHALEVIHRGTARSVWHYLRARYIYYTHGVYGYARPPSKKVVVNLWHGMPLKKLGVVDGTSPMRFTLTPAIGPLFQDVLREIWEAPRQHVIITGLPRNDRMLEARLTRSQALPVQPNQKLIVWLPTYRRSVVGQIRCDIDVATLKAGHVAGLDVTDFQQMLVDLDAVCILKLHPMASRSDYPPSSGRLLVWDEAALREHEMTVAQLLGSSDALISDASSVWIDYLLLGKPIVFAFGDIASYTAGRGFIRPELLTELPGPLVTTGDSLVTAVREALTTDPYRAARSSLADRWHAHQDANSSQRLVDAAIARATGSRR
jgi:CDP-glycerol glycerophosphotransferase (TagB/SpsB family)